MNRENKIGYNSVLLAYGLLLFFFTGVTLADENTQLSDSLRNSLQAQGWQEYQAADGSVIYHLPTIRAEAGNQDVSSTDEQRNQLGSALEQSGWQAEWSEDGSLILRPQAGNKPLETVKEPSPANTQVDVIPDLPGFDYWRIERDDDGSVRFHPVEISPVTGASNSDSAVLGQCEGYQLQLENVSLPIDEWSEITKLARDYLQLSGFQGLQVGRVRKVLRIYLVSLVEEVAPYRLVHQLAVRASDGKVMLLE
ncbi:MAG: hypothetical protein KZQ90_12580 [Candidatus Thiodiazotropha sp. (ex Codakia rugifera)]|nr:hypothetical protein [Candidatus Thiodiazotropha sp. (ex Codakia rugifera)]